LQYKRPRTTCQLCPLRDHKRVWSELTASESKPVLAVLGENPGLEEDRDGKPFTGPSGKLLNWALHESGVSRSNVYIANAICCRPTDGAIDTLEASEALSYCRAGLYDELVVQYDRGLRVLVALGQVAMTQLGLSGKIGTYRGSLMSVTLPGKRVLTVIPTYHPSMVLRMNWKRSNGGNAKGAVEWLADFRKAGKLAREGGSFDSHTLKERFNLEPTVEDIESFVEDAIANKKLVAVDIETSGLGFDACKIVVVGLATSTEDALCVPFLTTGAAPVYTNGRWERVKAALRRLFSTCPQVYQNSFFDVPRLRAFGFPIPYKLIAHDTLILHHCLAAEMPHDLGYIVSVYGKTPYWKGDFKNRIGTIFDMDQLEMRRYNLRDCVVLHQVLDTMLRDLKELDLEGIYYNEALPLIEPVMEMTQYGVGIDLGRVKRHKEWLEKEAERGTRELYELGGLPPEFNVASTSQMRWLLYGEPISTFAKIDERDAKRVEKNASTDEKIREIDKKIAEVQAKYSSAPNERLAKQLAKLKTDREKRLSPKPKTKVEQEIEALRIVRDEVKPIYRLSGFQPATTETGMLATDREGLLSYKIALTNRRAIALGLKRKDTSDEVAAIDRLLAFIDRLGEVSRVRKIISTYTRYEPWADGRVHPYWKLHGTASGRLACIAGSSRIKTNRGCFPIALYEHQLGDTILTHTGVERRIARFFRNGTRPCMSLTLDSGPSIICTTDHRFLTPEGWKTWSQLSIGTEVFYVSVESGDELGGNLSAGFGSLSGEPGEANCGSSGKNAGGIRAHVGSDSQEICGPIKAEDRESSQVLPIEDGEKESSVWKARSRVSDLEGSMLGQQGTLHSSDWVEAGICASSSVRRSTWDTCRTAAEQSNNPPHRRESCEQHDRQSGSLYKFGAHEVAPKVGRVASKSFVGTLPVFDLEVEEDHSYVAEGFIVHNCTVPNLMNLPNLDTDHPDPICDPVRGFFVARPGWKFISADYVNLEAQLLAYSTLEPELVDVFTHGLNLHDVNTAALFGVTKDSPDWKPCRRAAKIDFFGNKCYGGSDYAIYQKMMLEVPELRVTFKEYAAANQRWFAAHPAYSEWAQRVRTEVRQRRQARTPFGRVRFFFDNDRDIEKEALNHMIQSSGASLVNRAMIRIEKRLRSEKLQTRFVMQVHDELIIEARDDEVERSQAILVEEMSREFDFLGFKRSIPVEAVVGPDLAQL